MNIVGKNNINAMVTQSQHISNNLGDVPLNNHNLLINIKVPL